MTIPPAGPTAQSPPSGCGGVNPLLRRGRAVDPSIAAGGGGGGYGGGYGGYAAATAPYNSGGFVQPEQAGSMFGGQQAAAPVANIFTPEPMMGGGGMMGSMMPGHGKEFIVKTCRVTVN